MRALEVFSYGKNVSVVLFVFEKTMCILRVFEVTYEKVPGNV